MSKAYRSNFWKFFVAFLVILSTAVGGYALLTSRGGNDGAVEREGAGENSFFSSVGENAKEAFTSTIGTGGGDGEVVEVVDVRSGGSVGGTGAGVGESTGFNESVVSDGAEPAGAPRAPSEAEPEPAESDEPKFIPCAFSSGGAPSRDTVVINEVAWMGGAGGSGLGANDEWIELKNTSNSRVTLSGWQLVDVSGQIQAALTGSIAAGGFYLLERTDDNSVPGVAADVVYSGSLSNTNEALRLFGGGCVLEDEVSAIPDWPGGDAPSRRTMQRESDLTWSTFGGGATGGIWGTPREANGPALAPGADELPAEEPGEPSPPPAEEAPARAPAPDTSGKININTADFETLQEITGVGPVIAGRIIEYREANGPFGAIEEIKNVKGIGDKTFEEMKDEITV